MALRLVLLQRQEPLRLLRLLSRLLLPLLRVLAPLIVEHVPEELVDLLPPLLREAEITHELSEDLLRC